MTPEQREIQRKRRVIEYAEQTGNIRKTCRYFGVGRSSFYLWRARYREFGDSYFFYFFFSGLQASGAT
jgi:transposase